MLRKLILAALVGFGLATTVSPLDALAADEASTSSSLSAGLPSTTSRSRDFTLSFFNLTSAPMEQVSDRYARLSAYNYLALNYRMSRAWKASLRPVFMFGTAGAEASGTYRSWDLKVGDPYATVAWSKNNLFDNQLDSELDASVTMRVYAPLSDSSVASGMVTRVRPEVVLEQWLGQNVSLETRIEPDTYVQSRTASLDDRGRARGNKRWGYETIVGPWAYFMKRDFAAGFGVGYDQMTSFSSEVNGLLDENVRDTLKVQASIKGSIGPVFFIAGATQKRDQLRPRDQYGFMRDTETEYFILNSWRL